MKNLINLKLTKKNLKIFLDNLRYEDSEEMKLFFKNNSIDDFYKICQKNKKTTYFLSDFDKNPVALGGCVPYKDKSAIVWLLSTKEVYKYKIELFKYIKNKIEFFKKRYSFLYNYIYKSNFEALKWLNILGFKSVDVDNKEFKLFYFKDYTNKKIERRNN